ncbi:MAG: hypothetical protein COV66_06270 [Nitrospinae bacterium CG11_big_fil_rev_8_21_14_0_20_45_15]|nr:MAG: hypothetical protein COV66_06270 [Nitrospinae bacterium CG11_big_fil_rev_8_21_14_0_20_45_15]
MMNFWMQLKNRLWQGQEGASMLMAVVLAIVTMAAIVFNFLAESEQKQSGASVTYTSTNAFLLADAGVRYVEKCLKNPPVTPDACPTGASSIDWKNDFITTPATTFTKNFPTSDSSGTFSIEFIQNAINDTNNIRIRSTGTYKGAIRTIGSTVSRFTTCVLGQQAISYCTASNIKNSASTTDPNSPVQSCPAVTVDLFYPSEYPDDPTSCPNPEYLDYTNGSPTLAPPYQYCDWNLDGTTAVSVGAFNYIASGGAASGQAVVKVNSTSGFVAGMKVRLTRGALLPGGASAGATTVTLNSTSGFAANQLVKFVNLSTLGSVLPTIEEIKIQSVDSATQLTLASALGSSYNANDVADLTDISTSATNEEHTISSVNGGTNELTLSGNLSSTYPEGSSVESVIEMWVANDFSMRNKSSLTVKGALKINVGNDVILENTSEMLVFGSVALHMDNNFLLKNAAKMNEVMSFAGDLLIQVGNDALFANSSSFAGGVIANHDIVVENNAELTGSLSGDTVNLVNNATLIFDPSSGADSEGIDDCVPATFNPPSQNE